MGLRHSNLAGPPTDIYQHQAGSWLKKLPCSAALNLPPKGLSQTRLSLYHLFLLLYLLFLNIGNMKYALAPLAFTLGASAAALKRSQCCFDLTASGGVSGTVGQLTDGQNRIGGGYSPTSFCLSNGGITDSNGRGCIVTNASGQFQCDEGKAPTTGFSVGSNGTLTFNGKAQFYGCPAADDQDNIYTRPVQGQEKCVPVMLSTSGQCSSSSGGQGTPSGSVPFSTPVASGPVPGTPYQTPYGTPAYSAPAGTSPAYSAPAESAPGEQTYTVPVTSYTTECPESTAGASPSPSWQGQSQAGSSVENTQPAQETPPPQQTEATPAYTPSAYSTPGGGVPQSSIPAASPPYPYDTPQPSPGVFTSPAPAASQPSGPATPVTPVPSVESSAGGGSAPTPVVPNTPGTPYAGTPYAGTPSVGTPYAGTPYASSPYATPAATPAGACPTNLAGDYQYPHLIVPINSSTPSTAYGTQYNGTLDSSTCTTYNFDIPTNYTGSTCTLEFLFPHQEELETSAFEFSAGDDDSVEFSALTAPVDQSTSWDTVPAVQSVYGSWPVRPGNGYVLASGTCKAGQTFGVKACSKGGLELNYFQDWNPSPIGLFVRRC